MSDAFIVRRGGKSGPANAAVTIELRVANGDVSLNGVKVTITDVEEDAEFKSFLYDGPHTVMIPAGMRYRVHVDNVEGLGAPADVEYSAVAGVPRLIIMEYRFGIRYGFKRDKNDSSPTGRITYLYDAIDKEPMYVDQNTGEPHYGDWKSFIDQLVRPVMLKNDGTVDYELDRDNQSIRADTSEKSDVDNTDYEGNAMVEFGGPFKWVKRYEDESYEYVIFCDVRYDDEYHAYAHTNAQGEVADAFYWGMFFGSATDGKTRSIGKGGARTRGNRSREITEAEANGEGYYTIYKSGWDFIADILTLISRNDNSQEAFGYGRVSTDLTYTDNGKLIDKGAFWGTKNQKDHLKVLYIENPWGGYMQSMAGMIVDNEKNIRVKMTPPYNLTGDGYHNTGIVPVVSGDGYISEASVTDLYGFVPKTGKGSATTYYCDTISYNNPNTARYAMIGGGLWTTRTGSRHVRLDLEDSVAYDTMTSRLTYIPTKGV